MDASEAPARGTPSASRPAPATFVRRGLTAGRPPLRDRASRMRPPGPVAGGRRCATALLTPPELDRGADARGRTGYLRRYRCSRIHFEVHGSQRERDAAGIAATPRLWMNHLPPVIVGSAVRRPTVPTARQAGDAVPSVRWPKAYRVAKRGSPPGPRAVDCSTRGRGRDRPWRTRAGSCTRRRLAGHVGNPRRRPAVTRVVGVACPGPCPASRRACPSRSHGARASSTDALDKHSAG
jgi:hypothetical protein